MLPPLLSPTLFCQLQGKIGSSGRIIAIGVKVTAVGSNQDLTNIDWGDLTAGATATRQISVINNGTIPTTLSMSAGDWIPLIAQQYLTITWNYASGTVLQPGASQTVTITINVNQYVTGVNTFTNTIYIIATQSSVESFSPLFLPIFFYAFNYLF